MSAADPTREAVSPEAQRLLQFVKFNEPAGPIGCLICLGTYFVSGAPFLLIVLAAVAVNWVGVVRARRQLQADQIEPAVVSISAGMWAILGERRGKQQPRLDLALHLRRFDDDRHDRLIIAVALKHLVVQWGKDLRAHVPFLCLCRLTTRPCPSGTAHGPRRRARSR